MPKDEFIVEETPKKRTRKKPSSTPEKENQEVVVVETEEETKPKRKKKTETPVVEEESKEELVVEETPEVVEEVIEEPQVVILPKPEEVKVTEEKEKIPNKIEKFIYKKQKQSKIEERKRIKKEDALELKRYNPDPNYGLSDDYVAKRKADGLVNATKIGSTKSIKKIIFSNLVTFFNILTYAIAGILISVRAFTDLFFVVIVTANVIIGIIQEIKAKNIIDKLSIMQAPTAFVMRNGVQSEIAINDVVLDDIVVLSQGKQIPADSILLDGSVEVNESLLTGESDAILKKPGDILYSGSFIVSGTCKAKVDKVGKDNYISRLSGEAKLYKKPKSDLLRSLRLIVYFMALVIIPIGIILFYVQYFANGVDYVTSIRKSAGSMVGMIPSGLMLLSSVALAVGVIRLAQNKVMVQELYCIEMLARVNVLCLDKTGTITDGTMSVKDVIEYNNVAGITTKIAINGMLNALKESNLTAKALEEKFGANKKIKYHSLINFSSQRKYNAVSFERYGTFIMGAPEFVLKEEFEEYKKDVNNYSKQGYRVLALAHKEGYIEDGNLPIGELTLVALILIEDNIRPDAIETINYFKESGVEVKVISGDNPLTVSKISERAGILNAKDCISLDGMSDEDVVRAATRYTVFGRVSPDQKRILVKALKSEGKTVAMTGDGVNDILALREADCSIAMASGSEAARNASHLVLIDSNFNSMPKVVAEGRRVINNVARVACLFLTKTIFSFLLALQALNSGGIYPISTVQLSIIDFFVVGIPAFFLVLEPNNNPVDSKFLPNILKGALPGAITILVCSMLTFQLVDYLNYDFLTSSTIIIIVATNVCLMVLFKVCRPFNKLRKVICGTSYTLFVLCIIFLPSLFEIRPLFKFMEYTSDTVEITQLDTIPSVKVSEDYNYVLDGVVYDTKATPNYTTISASSRNGYLTLNSGQNSDIITKDGEYYKIADPSLSVDFSGNLYAGGYTTTAVMFTEDPTKIKLEIASDGYITILSIDDSGIARPVANQPDYSILPTITYNSSGGYLIVNGNNSAGIYKWDGSSIESISLDENLNVLINGKLYTYTSEDGQQLNLTVPYPAISTNSSGYIVIDAQAMQYVDGANISLSSIGVTSLTELLEHESTAETYDDEYIRANGNYYQVKDVNSTTSQYVTSNVYIIVPNITTSVAGRYIINGEYTDYEVLTIGGDSSTSFNVTEDGYLTINDFKTDYKADYSVQVGGVVQRLSIPAILILLTLCLASSPFIKILAGCVPWLKQTIKNVQNILSKF